MEKGFVKTDFIGDGVELYIPQPPKELMTERKVLVLPFYVNNQPAGKTGKQRIHIIFEYYSQNEKTSVIEMYMQVGVCVYRKLMSVSEVDNNDEDMPQYMIGMLFNQFLNHGEVYDIYCQYMAEIGALTLNVPGSEIERNLIPGEDLMDGFIEVE